MCIGSGEGMLLMGCGMPPGCSICLGRMAAALVANLAEGPRLEVCACILSGGRGSKGLLTNAFSALIVGQNPSL